MQVWPNIKALKACCVSVVMLAVSFGFAVPVQAGAHNETGIQSMDIADLACSKDNVEDYHHQVGTDCCEKQPCPQDMDCGIDCVAHSVGTTALLKEYLPSLHQDKSEILAPIVLASHAYMTAFDAPPPRN